MEDRFANRLGMFQTALGTLNSPEHKPTWDGQAPVIFTTKVANAQTAFDDLQDFVTQHTVDITGPAVDKEREKQELEDAIFALSQAMVCWFRDQNDETNAAKVDRSISAWRRMRDQELVAQATIARDLAQSVVDGPDAVPAADYGITAAAVTSVSSELADVEAILTAPQESIAGRRALTVQYRTRFNEVEAKFEAIDAMILQFGTTDPGRGLIAAYQASRVVRDLGSGGGTNNAVPFEIESLTQNEVNVDVTYVPGGGANATTLLLLWQVVGIDPGFDQFTALIDTGQSIGPFSPGETIRVKTRAENASGAVESAVQEITLV